jgi:hypothetical protein
MSSFISFCFFSYPLFFVSWNYLSASCTFWLTMSSIISMKFSVITCRISSLRMFLWTSLGPLVSFIFVLLESRTRYQFSSFPSESCIKLFWWGENGFHPFFFFLSLYLVLCQYVLDRLVGGSVTSFLSLDLILFCGCIGFLAKCVCYFCPWSGCSLVLTNSQV